MAKKSIIPFGPQHPVLPEPLQLRLVLDDEKVVEALPAIGYVHRGLEKLAETKDFQQVAFLAERICGICSFIHSQAYCQGVEEILGVQVPDRARFLRVIWAELHRMHSHLLWLGLLADAFGFENVFMGAWRVRETVLDIMEATTGGRIMLGACCVGGTRRDLSDEQVRAVHQAVDKVTRELEKLAPAVLKDYSIRQRTVNVGKITQEQAHTLGAVGPVALACGIKHDLRTQGYAAYGELSFTPVTEEGGDAYARLAVRVRELYASAQLIHQALDKLPTGPISVPIKGNPSGESLTLVEQPRGEVVYYIKGNGQKNLERLRVRTPTFANIAPLLAMLPGCQLADVPVIALSIDPCISCTER